MTGRPAASGRRCIPAGCVASPSNTARYFGRRAGWTGNTGEGLARKAADLDPMFLATVMVDGWINLEVVKFREAIPALKKAKAMESPPFCDRVSGVRLRRGG